MVFCAILVWRRDIIERSERTAKVEGDMMIEYSKCEEVMR